MTRVCNTCFAEKALTEFAYCNLNHQYRRRTCNSCLELGRGAAIEARRERDRMRAKARIEHTFGRCAFCSRASSQILPEGPYKGWPVCGRRQCGLQQIEAQRRLTLVHERKAA